MKQWIWSLIALGAVLGLHLAVTDARRAAARSDSPAPRGVARPETVAPGPDGGTRDGTGAVAASTDASSQAARRAAHVPGGRSVVLRHAPLGATVAAPRVVLVHADGDRRVRLGADAPAVLPDGVRGPWSVVADGAGWLVEPSTLDVGAGEVEVAATSRHLLRLALSEVGTGRAVERATVSVECRWLEGCCPTGVASEPLVLDAPDGELLLEGLPVDRGEVRLTAWSDGHRAATGAWIPVEAGLVDAALELEPLAGTRAEVSVRVVNATGRAVPGCRVALVEVDPEAPVVEAWIEGGALQVARAGDGRPRRRSEARTTDADGRATLVARAPARVRLVATGPSGRRSELGPPFDLMPEARLERALRLGGTGRLEGSVRFELGPGERPPGPVTLDLPGRRLVAELDPAGHFVFDALAAGDYRLELLGVLDDPLHPDGELRTGLAARRVRVEPEAVTRVELDLRPGRGRTATIELPAIDAPAGWRWLVLVVDGEQQQAPEVLARRAGRGGGRVTVAGLPESAAAVVALGVRGEGEAVALAHGALDLAAETLCRPTVGPTRRALRVVGGASRSVGLACPSGSGFERGLVEGLPPLTLVPGRTLELLGLPDAPVLAQVDGEWLPLPVGREVRVGGR